MDVVSIIMPIINKCLVGAGLPAWGIALATKAIEEAIHSELAAELKKELFKAAYDELVKAFPTPTPLQHALLAEAKTLLGIT